MDKPTLYITNGIIFLVSFISLYGLLLDANTAIRAIWEILFLFVGIGLIQAIPKSQRMLITNTTFYAVNMLLVILFRVATQSKNFFSSLTMLLLLLGFLVSTLAIKTKKTLRYIPIDAIAIDGKTVAESKVKKNDKKSVKTVKKSAKKKAKKKTTKKKAAKKKSKK